MVRGELSALNAELQAAWAAAAGVPREAVSVMLAAGSLVIDVEVRFEGAGAGARATEARGEVADLTAVAESVRRSPRLAAAMGVQGGGGEMSAEEVAGFVRVERNEKVAAGGPPAGEGRGAGAGAAPRDGGPTAGGLAGVAVGAAAALAAAVALGLALRRRRQLAGAAAAQRRTLSAAARSHASFYDGGQDGGAAAGWDGGGARELSMSVFNPLHASDAGAEAPAGI